MNEKILKKLLVSPLAYEQSRLLFDQKCSSMVEYLKFYNLLDTQILLQSIQTYAEGFMDWNLDIYQLRI